MEAARSKTQEKRVMGKVFRDDQGTAAEDIIAVLESEADDYIQVRRGSCLLQARKLPHG